MTIFSIVLASGLVLGLIWITSDFSDRARSFRLEIGICALSGVLIGARTAYVSVNWAYFQENFSEIFQIWLGGLSWPGALAGGLFAVVVSAWVMGIPLSPLMDDLFPLLVSLAAATWLGCWLTGCAYGSEARLGLPSKDEWGIWELRFPLQLLAALLTVALSWGIERFRHSSWGLMPGLAASLGVAGFSLILLGTSVLRADPYPMFIGIRLETWAALIFLGISMLSGVVILLLNRR